FEIVCVIIRSSSNRVKFVTLESLNKEALSRYLWIWTARASVPSAPARLLWQSSSCFNLPTRSLSVGICFSAE
ncbi:hypothetical protein R1flu_023346, partial [Riccia fluitans]